MPYGGNSNLSQPRGDGTNGGIWLNDETPANHAAPGQVRVTAATPV